ncbi:MAG: hypothetical protein WCT85_06770 [Parachlamydiales bacterium]|jgi:hypothetical protein
MKKLFLFVFFNILPLLAFSNQQETQFTPWYTGPLISTGQNNISPGSFTAEPYLYYTITYDKSVPKTFSFINQLLMQGALTDWLDITGEVTYIYNEKEDQHFQQFADTIISLGIQLLKEERSNSKPSVRLKIYESFPTGDFDDLDPSKLGIDATGTGSYQTTFDVIIGKTSYWITNHPIDWKFSTSYTISTDTNVNNFHRFGGGFGTTGKIHPGNIFIEDIAFEFSFTQRWVYAMDIIYTYAAKTSFKGIAGIDILGNLAQNTSLPSKQMALAPALEYNFTDNLGIIGGVFFSVWQKNSLKFISGIISVAYTF